MCCCARWAMSSTSCRRTPSGRRDRTACAKPRSRASNGYRWVTHASSLTQSLSAATACSCRSAAFRHLVQVLRCATGEGLTLFNGEGGEFEATLDAVGKREAHCTHRRFHDADRESPLHDHAGAGRIQGRAHGLHAAEGGGTGRERNRAAADRALCGQAVAERWDTQAGTLAEHRHLRLRAMRAYARTGGAAASRICATGSSRRQPTRANWCSTRKPTRPCAHGDPGKNDRPAGRP